MDSIRHLTFMTTLKSDSMHGTATTDVPRTYQSEPPRQQFYAWCTGVQVQILITRHGKQAWFIVRSPWKFLNSLFFSNLVLIWQTLSNTRWTMIDQGIQDIMPSEIDPLDPSVSTVSFNEVDIIFFWWKVRRLPSRQICQVSTKGGQNSKLILQECHELARAHVFGGNDWRVLLPSSTVVS